MYPEEPNRTRFAECRRRQSACPVREIPANAQSPSRSTPVRVARHLDCSDRERLAIARRPRRRQAKAGSFVLAWHRTRRLIGRAPACHPVFYIVQRHGRARLLIGVKPPAILTEIGS